MKLKTQQIILVGANGETLSLGGEAVRCGEANHGLVAAQGVSPLRRRSDDWQSKALRTLLSVTLRWAVRQSVAGVRCGELCALDADDAELVPLVQVLRCGELCALDADKSFLSLPLKGYRFA